MPASPWYFGSVSRSGGPSGAGRPDETGQVTDQGPGGFGNIQADHPLVQAIIEALSQHAPGSMGDGSTSSINTSGQSGADMSAASADSTSAPAPETASVQPDSSSGGGEGAPAGAGDSGGGASGGDGGGGVFRKGGVVKGKTFSRNAKGNKQDNRDLHGRPTYQGPGGFSVGSR
jgi:hypothetical protein